MVFCRACGQGNPDRFRFCGSCGSPLEDHADALLDLAGVLQLAGRSRDATDAARHALALYDQKGNLVLARKARRMVHELGRA
jgi:zinc-ribbon domain